MSVEEIVNDIENSLSSQREDLVESYVEELPYEQFWKDRDEAVDYARERLEESHWEVNFTDYRSAVRYYVIAEQRDSGPESPQTTYGPQSPF